MSLPVDFESKVKQAPVVGINGYPYQISARDLMANFKYLDQWPEKPGAGTFVLGCVDGVVQWLGTDGCEPDSASATP